MGEMVLLLLICLLLLPFRLQAFQFALRHLLPLITLFPLLLHLHLHLHNLLLLSDILEMSGCQSNGASQITTSSLGREAHPCCGVLRHNSSDSDDPLDLIQAGAASTPEPTSFRQSQQRSDADLWQKACEEEMEAHRLNGTWEIVKLPSGKCAIGSRWFMKVKHNADGSLNRYKARLVAKGYTVSASWL